MIERNVLDTTVRFFCGSEVKVRGYVPPVFPCPGCGSPAVSVERTILAEPGVDINESGDGIVLAEGSLEQAAVEAVLADSLPLKLEGLARVHGGLTEYELDVLAKALGLVKVDALTRINRANRSGPVSPFAN
jgi:hypothetical protein